MSDREIKVLDQSPEELEMLKIIKRMSNLQVGGPCFIDEFDKDPNYDYCFVSKHLIREHKSVGWIIVRKDEIESVGDETDVKTDGIGDSHDVTRGDSTETLMKRLKVYTTVHNNLSQTTSQNNLKSMSTTHDIKKIATGAFTEDHIKSE